MKPVITIAASLAGFLTAGPVLAASCTERITALEARLDKAADTAISTSSGGQGVAGAREGQAIQADRGNVPAATPAVPYQHEAKEAGVVERSAEQAGGGGDRVMQAKATLNQAKSFDRQGNATACDEAVAEAQKQLDPQ